jgi:Ca2+-transporting ATPase
MATFHHWTDASGAEVVRCFVKGAPDVLVARADRYLGGTNILPFDQAAQQRYAWDNAKLAEQGMCVLVLARRTSPTPTSRLLTTPRS